MWAPRGFGDLEIRAIFQVAGKNWYLFHRSRDLGSPTESKNEF